MNEKKKALAGAILSLALPFFGKRERGKDNDKMCNMFYMRKKGHCRCYLSLALPFFQKEREREKTIKKIKCSFPWPRQGINDVKVAASDIFGL